MKKSSFTLMEVLLAMAVIGIIAGAVANQIKGISADKVKLSFKNNFNHMSQTIDSIVADENILPASHYSTYDDKTGKKERRTFCNAYYALDNNGNTVEDFNIFAKEFVNRTGGVTNQVTVGNAASMADSPGIAFDTKNGSHWVVRRNPQNLSCQTEDVDDIAKTDFIIIFDIDGIHRGSNCPYTGTNLSTEVKSCSNPDTFKFGTTVTNKILPDTKTVYNGRNLSEYMRINNLLKDKF